MFNWIERLCWKMFHGQELPWNLLTADERYLRLNRESDRVPALVERVEELERKAKSAERNAEFVDFLKFLHHQQEPADKNLYRVHVGGAIDTVNMATGQRAWFAVHVWAASDFEAGQIVERFGYGVGSVVEVKQHRDAQRVLVEAGMVE